MSDDKQKPRKRIRIPTPKELDESAEGGQSQQDGPRKQKGVRSRVGRFRMRMRGGVGENKKVLKAPRLDVPSVKESAPDRQDSGEVESSVSQPSPKPVPKDEGGQEDSVSPEADVETDSDFKDEVGEKDKQEVPSGSRIRDVKLPPEHRKKKEEPVPVAEEPPKKLTLEEQACAEARANAQKYGHEIGDFVEKPRFSNDRVFIAICKKCGLNINGEVLYNYKVGLVRVSGKAKNKRCTGGGGGYSSGTS